MSSLSYSSAVTSSTSLPPGRLLSADPLQPQDSVLTSGIQHTKTANPWASDRFSPSTTIRQQGASQSFGVTGTQTALGNFKQAGRIFQQEIPALLRLPETRLGAGLAFKFVAPILAAVLPVRGAFGFLATAVLGFAMVQSGRLARHITRGLKPEEFSDEAARHLLDLVREPLNTANLQPYYDKINLLTHNMLDRVQLPKSFYQHALKGIQALQLHSEPLQGLTKLPLVNSVVKPLIRLMDRYMAFRHSVLEAAREGLETASSQGGPVSFTDANAERLEKAIRKGLKDAVVLNEAEGAGRFILEGTDTSMAHTKSLLEAVDKKNYWEFLSGWVKHTTDQVVTGWKGKSVETVFKAVATHLPTPIGWPLMMVGKGIAALVDWFSKSLFNRRTAATLETATQKAATTG